MTQHFSFHMQAESANINNNANDNDLIIGTKVIYIV